MNTRGLLSLILLASFLFFQTCEKAPTLEDFYDEQDDKKDSLTVAVPTAPTVYQINFINAINEVRAEGCNCGEVSMPSVGPVVWNRYLEAAGIIHAIDMNENDYFSHYSLDGKSPGQRVTDVGYIWSKVGENLEVGEATIEQIIDAFIASPNHCKVMMDGVYTELGIGLNGDYKVFDFAKPQK